MTLNDLAQHIEDSYQGRMPYDAKYLMDFDSYRLAVLACEAVQSAVVVKRGLVPSCEYIGKKIRFELGLPLDGTKNFRGGLFLLNVLRGLGLIDKYNGWDRKIKNSRAYIKVTNYKAMAKLWSEITPEASEFVKPSLTQPADWTSAIHESGLKMVKRGSNTLHNNLKPSTHPMLFDVLNNKQAVGYKVNQRVLAAYNELFEQGHPVFEHKNPLLKPIEQRGKEIEATEIRATANSLGDNTFYHTYNFDFRGRIYPTTGYFHEQSSDNAKGLLLLAKKVALGDQGFQWLLIHAANSWGEDKLPLQGRIDFAMDNLDQWIDWSVSPMADLGWTEADKPWSFLSTIIEITKAWFAPDRTKYESGLICYIDGTTNGSQHLTALARDESIAHHVNLVPSDKPGDLYTLIADASFSQLEAMVDHNLDMRFQEIRNAFKAFQKELETTKDASEVWGRIKQYQADNKADIVAVAPQFWLQERVVAKKRKIAKRNVMTLGYGSETMGFKDQLKEDCPKELDELKDINGQWAWFMADLNFKNCIEELPGPAAMLKLFKNLAIRASKDQEQFTWIVPVTGFPVVQSYFDTGSKQINAMWGEERIQPRISLPEERKLNKRRQKQAASPNVVHSFDAAHLVMTCIACDFETVTIHDSFGCAAGNMADLFEIVRVQWIEFYDTDPLYQLLDQQSSLDLMPDRGNLCPTSVLDSQFAFS